MGSEFRELGLFVTTPNMNIVYAPLSVCKTRMRRQNHFGQDDPCYWPQPFHRTIGHLAVIPSPQVSQHQPLYWAWYQPVERDYEHVQVHGLVGMMRLSASLKERLREMSAAVLEYTLGLPENLLNDSYLVDYRDQLRKYLERLGEVGSHNIISLQVACMQRVVLELYARVQWLEKWVSRVSNVDSSYDVDPTVMGAFTGDLDIAATLFRIGMPVWLVRPYEQMVLARIDNMVAPLCENHYQRLPIRDSSDFFFDASDNTPPNPTIYTGLPGHYLRYSRMLIYVKQQFSSDVVGSFDNELDVTPSTAPPNSDNASSSQPMSSISAPLSWLNVTSREWVSCPQPMKRPKRGMFSSCFVRHTYQ